MKRFLIALLLCAFFAWNSSAQQSPADSPASKEDVEKYFGTMHSKEMMEKMVDAMSAPMHQMVHEQYLKEKDKPPVDFEVHMHRIMDDMMKSFPWGEMLQAMVPVYHKHLTKGDVDALVAFYTTPSGQKLLKEMPAITAEAMQTMMPLLQKSIQTMNERLKTEMTAMIQDLQKKSDTSKPVSNN